MAEVQIRLKGWQAVAGIVVVLGIAGARYLTLKEVKQSPDLVRKLETVIMTNYLPDDVERLKSAVKANDREGTSRIVESVKTGRITIESLQMSAPLLSFSTHQRVVLKVTYSLDDSSGNRARETRYYRFRHGAIGNTWSYEYETGALSYYSNFK